MGYKITKELLKTHPINIYDKDIKVVIECYICSVAKNFNINITIYNLNSKQQIFKEYNFRAKEFKTKIK